MKILRNFYFCSGHLIIRYATESQDVSKMVEEWAAWDNLNTMSQLGMTVVPAETK